MFTVFGCGHCVIVFSKKIGSMQSRVEVKMMDNIGECLSLLIICLLITLELVMNMKV